VTDAYYQLLDAADPIGERFSASDHVLGNWGPNKQSAAAVSALLVRALERCAPRKYAAAAYRERACLYTTRRWFTYKLVRSRREWRAHGPGSVR
jgi:hypothetical protein